MKIGLIQMQILVHLHVDKTNFHTKGFAVGLALKQRRKAARKSPISFNLKKIFFLFFFTVRELKVVLTANSPQSLPWRASPCCKTSLHVYSNTQSWP